ncbi:hypothetical protein EPD60_01170 [Flaviaesturariibacter flavus]|uniref:Lipocalin-like domain-containing protein n=1 Tax=Flaviaesturariibacter flavus TaxID=2502780 RepID=A0A4R1BP25_9BACT|nr:hypothetical protein [Flaviaesturariibacter flavus]TCJ19057.1 hypothetical protein EPD60_01170 [Flaviaesturariibacter flavus]
MKRLLLILFCVARLVCGAQGPNLNGVWKGTLTQNTGGCFPKYYIELQINTGHGDTLLGASYHYSDITNYVKKKFLGTWYASTQKLYLREGAVQTFRIPPDCIPCIKNYTLSYYRTGNLEILQGEWAGKVMNTDANCQPGELKLTRVSESAFKEIPELEVDTGMVRLDFYDNAEVDGDSITVRVNGKTILSNKKLNTTPITTYVHIDLKENFQEIEMVAENLGRIPPNTALLIVTQGKQRFKLFLTSTEQKSAKVRFIYDPDIGKRAQ